MSDEKKKSLKFIPDFFKKRKFQFIEGKESVFVYSGLFLAFIILLILVFFISANLIDKTQLELKFDSEKSFNSVYISLSDSIAKAKRTMQEEGVSGLGIYNTNGRVYQSLGDAPQILPLSKMFSSKNRGQDSTLGLFVYDEPTQTIEYFRLSRLNIVMETGEIELRSGRFVATEYPEIVYIKFDGSEYFSNVKKIKAATVAGILFLSAFFVLIIYIYHNNRKYRKQLVKNESLANLGAAARTLTHEIKNPLSAMTIQSALLKRTLPEEYTSDLEIIDHEISRLTDLTNRVSEFLKNPVGNPEKIELISFIKEIASLFKNNINLDFHVKNQVFIMFDASRARSVIENLIKNATESCTDRDPKVSVDLVCLKNRNIRVRVMDRGDGLPENAGNKIYDAFYTTKIHGSGIGLSISKQFVEAQGGKLRLYPREDGGTVAEILLKSTGEKSR